MSRYQFVLAFLAASVLLGCDDTLSPADVGRNVVPSGFFCTATPSQAYGPGYVYRLDGSGSELLVADLGNSATTFVYGVVLPTYDATVDRSAGLEISLLAPGTAAPSGAASAASSSTSRVAFTDGRYVLMNDAGVDGLVARINAEIVPKTGSRYFLVRDTIQARSMDLRISRQDEARLGGEASIAGMFRATPGVRLNRQETLSLVATFATSMNVCIRAVEIAPPPDARDQPPVSEGATWQVTNRSASRADIARILAK